MKLLKLSYRNIVINGWRSFTLASFIFMATLIVILFNAISFTIRGNMLGAVRYGLTADLQIRPGDTTEEDLFSIGATWEDMVYLEREEIEVVEKILDYVLKPDSYTPTIRIGVNLKYNENETNAMMIGLNLDAKAYQQKQQLVEGRYPEKANEMVLSKEQASNLEAQVGNTILINAFNKEEEFIQLEAKVVGIGDTEFLGGFGFELIYMDIKNARELSGLKRGEATDLLVYSSAPDIKKEKERLESLLEVQGTKGVFKVTQWQEMGGFLKAIIMMIIGELYAFIAIFMVIIGVLILNIIAIVLTERRKEIGTLRAIGFNRRQVLIIFVSEMVLVAVIGAVLGEVVALLILLELGQYTLTIYPPMDSIMGASYRLGFEPLSLLQTLGIMCLFTLVTALVPCYKATKERPVEILR